MGCLPSPTHARFARATTLTVYPKGFPIPRLSTHGHMHTSHSSRFGEPSWVVLAHNTTCSGPKYEGQPGMRIRLVDGRSVGRNLTLLKQDTQDRELGLEGRADHSCKCTCVGAASEWGGGVELVST
jgi:hypothetical protein